jgi:hypothetical protein
VLVAREARAYGLRQAPAVALAGIGADATALAALARGSIERRTLLL